MIFVKNSLTRSFFGFPNTSLGVPSSRIFPPSRKITLVATFRTKLISWDTRSIVYAVEAWNEKNPDKEINITYSDADTSVFLQHVADGSQDFTIIDLAMYNSYMEEFNYDVQKNDIPEDEAKMIAENSYAYYIFPQDQKDLREQVDKALKELKEDGTLTEISKKWYGQDAAPEDDKFEETIN